MARKGEPPSYIKVLTPEIVSAVIPEAYPLFVYESMHWSSGFPIPENSKRSTGQYDGWVYDLARTMKGTTLAFAGRMGSGKDHACDYCISKIGGEKVHVFDAGLMRATKFLGRPIEKPRDRPFLQAIGDLGRRLDANFWVRDAVEKIVAPMWSRGVNVFITGVRFPNEIEALAGLGVRTVLIRRPRILTGSPMERHPSETALDEYRDCLEILNDSTIAAFEDRVSTFLP
ncbi:ORF77 [Ictalurid herpesvirus 1]|nr:ORF77 [Ictalurid herpesvirus 1]